MADGWKCPNCWKAHGPHVDTCPERARGPLAEMKEDGTIKAVGFWSRWPFEAESPARSARVVDPITGRDLGPSD